LKIFIDRLAFTFHSSFLIRENIYQYRGAGNSKGEEIVKLPRFYRKGWALILLKVVVLKRLEPMTEKSQKEFDRIIDQQSKKFYAHW